VPFSAAVWMAQIGQDTENLRYFCEDEVGIYPTARRNCFSTTTFPATLVVAKV